MNQTKPLTSITLFNLSIWDAEAVDLQQISFFNEMFWFLAHCG